MLTEKSCGSIIYKNNVELRVLVIKQTRNGNWSFPKGHVEGNESETETAKREVMEEVGLSVNMIDGFREVISYKPKSNVLKDVVYFISNCENQMVKLQREEVCDYKWLRPKDALEILTFKNDRIVLKKALEFIEEII